ncbi:MAG: hypothetical protein H7321_02200, partial [Bacteroidia bacterium]|nr:hypothetical protein [Bacteroidia bacterium]
KPMITVFVSDSLLQGKGVNCKEIIKDLAKEILGGGGGQPFYATAGGKNAEGITKAIENGRLEGERLASL